MAHSLREERYDRIWYKFAQRLLPNPCDDFRTVLDVGAGACEFPRLARSRGYVVTCLDISQPDAARAGRLSFDALVADSNRNLPFVADSFGGAFLLDVIEHIFCAEHLVSELSRVVRPGGFLLVSTPNYAWVLNRITHLLGMSPDGEGYHHRFFTRNVLRNLLLAGGFEVVQKSSWTYPLPPFNRVRRVFGLSRVDWPVAGPLESILAYSFVWLCLNHK